MIMRKLLAERLRDFLRGSFFFIYEGLVSASPDISDVLRCY